MIIGNRVDVHGLLQEPGEEEAARSSATPIEAEGELVQVVVEVFVADRPLVGCQQPALEQGGYAVNSRHELAGQSMAAVDVCDLGTSAPSLKLGRTQKWPLHL
jgi:hypothetical protein